MGRLTAGRIQPLDTPSLRRIRSGYDWLYPIVNQLLEQKLDGFWAAGCCLSWILLPLKF